MVMINYRERFKIKISKGERCLSQAKEKLQKTDKQTKHFFGSPLSVEFREALPNFPSNNLGQLVSSVAKQERSPKSQGLALY